MTTIDLGIVGVGAIAEAIVTGLCAGPGAAPSILLSPRGRSRSQALASRYPSVRVADDNESVVREARVVLLSVRPQDADTALRGLAFAPGQAVISVMAGIPLVRLRALAAPAAELAIAIPLPSVAQRRGLTPIYPRQQDAQTLFDRLGRTIVAADEGALEAFSAASATVAAHFAYLASIGNWLAAQGIEKDVAVRYVAAAFAPLAEALSPPPADLMTLAEEHATRGGINEQFYVALRDAGVFETVERSLDQISDRLNQR